jgi:hypothetical protein
MMLRTAFAFLGTFWFGVWLGMMFEESRWEFGYPEFLMAIAGIVTFFCVLVAVWRGLGF